MWEKYGQVRYFYLNPKDFGEGPLLQEKFFADWVRSCFKTCAQIGKNDGSETSEP